jgi:hypothetical protein
VAVGQLELNPYTVPNYCTSKSCHHDAYWEDREYGARDKSQELVYVCMACGDGKNSVGL